LAGPIVELFRAEEQRLVHLFAALGEVAKGLKPRPVGVWIEGLSDPLNDIVSCWILGAPKTLTQLTDAFSQQLEPIEREFDVHVEVTEQREVNLPLSCDVASTGAARSDGSGGACNAFASDTPGAGNSQSG
jgi:hypothetical protein